MFWKKEVLIGLDTRIRNYAVYDNTRVILRQCSGIACGR